MDKPTQEQLDLTRDVLYWLETDLREYEPQAVNTITAYAEAADQIPEASDLDRL